jgi:hypothetical protein
VHQHSGPVKKGRQSVFFLLIILASFGLLYQLINDPLGLFSTILVIALVIAVFYGIYRYVTGDRTPKSTVNNDRNKSTIVPVRDFRKNTSSKSLYKPERVRPKRKEYPFKVIEGNKDKKKHSSS